MHKKGNDFVLHGMNIITKLHNLALSFLGVRTTTTTLSLSLYIIRFFNNIVTRNGNFFAGIIYSKTKSPMDAYVYAKAKALLINGQPKRTVNWIEQSKLLQCYYNCTTVGNIN